MNDIFFWFLINLDLILKSVFIMSSLIVAYYLIEIFHKQLKSEFVFHNLIVYIFIASLSLILYIIIC